MMTVIEHVDVHVPKLIGAFLTVLGITAAAASVFLFVPLSYLEFGLLVLFSVWLSWTLLRDGIPPSGILIANNPTQIGLRNAIGVRWFSTSECILTVNENGASRLIVDNRSIELSKDTRELLESLLDDCAT